MYVLHELYNCEIYKYLNSPPFKNRATKGFISSISHFLREGLLELFIDAVSQVGRQLHVEVDLSPCFLCVAAIVLNYTL